jgi:uncharacterized BrkB/YihY/UPF0761 family membrane protein
MAGANIRLRGSVPLWPVTRSYPLPLCCSSSWRWPVSFLDKRPRSVGIIEQVRLLVGNNGAKAVEALLEGSRNTTQGIVATAVGLITLLFGASGVMIELRDALNTIWEVPSRELVS